MSDTGNSEFDYSKITSEVESEIGAEEFESGVMALVRKQETLPSYSHQPSRAQEWRENVLRYVGLFPKKVAENNKALLLDVHGTGKEKYTVGLVDTHPRFKTAVSHALNLYAVSNINFVLMSPYEFIELFSEVYADRHIAHKSKPAGGQRNGTGAPTGSGRKQRKFWWGPPPKDKDPAAGAAVPPIAAKIEQLSGQRLDLTNLDSYYAILQKIENDNFNFEDLTTLETVVFFLQHFVLDDGASDWHFQCSSFGGVVRHRRQSKMHRIFDGLPLDLYKQIANSLCILVGRDPGRLVREPVESVLKLRIPVENSYKDVEFRFESMNSIPLPSICLRGQPKPITDITKVGLEERECDFLTEAISQDHGMVIVTGATGSGKTNTLNSLFSILEADDDLNILEFGKPIEIESERRVQVTIRDFADEKLSALEFQRAFKASLRMDPDVIAFTEIRDPREAQIAFHAASTGHLVFTTMHAADVEETFVRLFGMGLPRDEIGKGLLGICAQRLVNKLCLICREEDPEASLLAGRPIYRENGFNADGKPCLYCNKGFYGRTAVAEVLFFDKQIREWILDGKKPAEIVQLASKAGLFVTIKENARKKLMDGVTSESQIRTVVDLKTIYQSDGEPRVEVREPLESFSFDKELDEENALDADVSYIDIEAGN